MLSPEYGWRGSRRVKKKKRRVFWRVDGVKRREEGNPEFGISIPLIPAYTSFRYTALIRADILRALWTVWSWHTMRITVAPLCTSKPSLTRSQWNWLFWNLDPAWFRYFRKWTRQNSGLLCRSDEIIRFCL